MFEMLSKLRNTVILAAVLIVSALLGYAWAIAGVSVEQTGPWQMRAEYQAFYVQAVADAYAVDGEDAIAAQRLSLLCQENGNIPALQTARDQFPNPIQQANIDQLQTLAAAGVTQDPTAGVCETRPAAGTPLGIMNLVAPVLLVLGFLAIIGLGILQVMRGDGGTSTVKTVSGGTARTKAAPPPGSTAETVKKEVSKDEALEEARSVAQAGAILSKSVEKTDFEALGQSPPIVQFMTTFLHGDDLYDDSFSIETASGEFLGETGVGISESMGSSGDAKNVTALEVWLFDKNDIRTITKVLMSEHAFADDAVRAKLAPKGEAVTLKPGERITLETATLRIQARVVDMSYKADVMPPKSTVDRITLELAAWKREGGSVGGSGLPAGLPGSTPAGGLPPASGG